MAQKIVFQNAVLLGFSRGTKGAEASLKADYTQRVISAMDWAEMPECVSGSNLEGELDQAICQMIPKDEGFRKLGFEIDRAKAHSFSIVKRELEGKKGKGSRLELRFKIITLDENACTKMERWFLGGAKTKCQLQVSYTPAAKQEELPGTTDQVLSDDARQAVMEMDE